MPTPFEYDLSQWSEPFEHSSDKRRRLVSSSYVDALPGLKSVSTPVESRTYDDKAGGTITVPINCPGKLLPPLSVFQYFDRYPYCFGASQYCHEMRLSGHFSDTVLGDQDPLTCAEGWPKRWFH